MCDQLIFQSAAGNDNNARSFRVLLAANMDVPYPPSFYAKVENGSIPASVAILNGEAVGCVAWKANQKGEVEILILAVRVTQRRQGVGRALLDHVKERAEARTVLTLCSRKGNEEAESFYERVGFERVCEKKNYYPRLNPPDAVEWKMKC